MISDSLNSSSWGEPMPEPRNDPQTRVRNGIVRIGVVLAHGLGLSLVIQHSADILKIEAGRPAGGSVQVRLVAAPVPKPPEPRLRTVEKPVLKPPVQKKTPVLSSDAPATRAVQIAQPEVAKPVESAPPPVMPAPPVETALPAQNQAAAPVQAPPAANPTDSPRQISANELRQLGCQIPRPDYPAKARRLAQEGTVVVRLSIGADGVVGMARVYQSSGYPLLDAAALATIRAGHCQPYISAGTPRAVEATQPVAFNLND